MKKLKDRDGLNREGRQRQEKTKKANKEQSTTKLSGENTGETKSSRGKEKGSGLS